MKLLEVDFVGGDFNMAVKGPVADVFSDAEFMAPGSSPLWGAGGLEGDNEDRTGFLCMPRRPFHWFDNKHRVHTFSNDQLGLNERDESTLPSLYASLGNLPLGWHPSCPTKRCSTNEAALEGNNKERAQAPTTPGPSHISRGGSDSKYSLGGKAANCLTHAPSLPIRCHPVTHRSMRLMCPVTPKVLPRMEQILETLTFYLPLPLTRGNMAKWWGLNRYTWNEYVDRGDAQETEFRELHDDMTNDGWFSD